MNRKVEVFTAGCPVCEPVVEMVKSMACENCEVTVYNLMEHAGNNVIAAKVKDYAITSLPAVAINGELLSCCVNQGVNAEVLRDAGLGQNK